MGPDSENRNTTLKFFKMTTLISASLFQKIARQGKVPGFSNKKAGKKKGKKKKKKKK